MSNVVFILDSGSDFEKENRLNLTHPVEVVPLNIHFGDEVYLDGVDLSKDEFYAKMEQSAELPKTSQPSPQSFHDVFKKHLDEGKEVLCITISSELSGTYQSTLIAKDMLEEDEQQRVHLIDSRNITVVILFLIKMADRLLNEGKSISEVVQAIEETKERVRFFGILDTLENLKKGGRISPAQAMIGGLLNIKPLCTIANGKVESIGKARGRKKGLLQLQAFVGDLNQYEDDVLFIAHSFKTDEEAKDEALQVIDMGRFGEVHYYKFGSTIGTHAGKNVLGICLRLKHT
jgi:DegV family protein with EDD domain